MVPRKGLDLSPAEISEINGLADAFWAAVYHQGVSLSRSPALAGLTSLPLALSNLVNIVSANFFDVRFGWSAAVMAPTNPVSLLVTLAVL